MFWLNYRFGFIFDYMAFGLPVFKSGMIGFDNISLILNQRMFICSSGLSLVLATVLLFRRLPQSKSHTVSFCMFYVNFPRRCSCLRHSIPWSFYRKNINEKRMVIESNRQFENRNFVSLTAAEIDFRHNESSFEFNSNP